MTAGTAVLAALALFQNCGLRKSSSSALTSSGSESSSASGEDARLNLISPAATANEGAPQIRFEPDLASAPFNQSITVNWSFGSGATRENSRGEIRSFGPGCARAVRMNPIARWTTVDTALRGSAPLAIDPSFVQCTASFCLITQTPGASPRETCRDLRFDPGRPVIDVSISASETAWDQEVSYTWKASNVSNPSASLSFDGASCALRGQTETLTSAANGAEFLIYKAGSAQYANCDARFCVQGISSINSVTPASECRSIHFHPSTRRPSNWVRDGRYFYDPTGSKTPHITWEFATVNASTIEVAIGSMPGKSDLAPWTRATQPNGIRFLLPSGSFQTGRSYFATVRALGADGQVLAEARGNGWRMIRDDEPPRRAANGASPVQLTGLTEVVDDAFITVRSPETLRQRLIEYLWPQGGLPSQMPQETRNETDIAATLNAILGTAANAGVPDGATIPQATASVIEATDSLTRIIVRNPAGLESHAFLLTPKTSRRNRLAIFHHGHSDTLAPYGGARTIDFFLRSGFDVLAFFMPGTGPGTPSLSRVFEQAGSAGNGQRRSHADIIDLWRRAPAGTLGEHPIAAFMTPIRVALNYARSRQSYEDISMIGISGGGWATTLYAALDPQIKYSFPVAGSLPMYLRIQRPMDISDDEQFLPELYSIAGWLDLYVLGASGEGRRQIQILAGQDSCCFRPTSSNDYAGVVVPFTDRHLTYSERVAQVASENRGRFEVQIDAPADHTISDWTLGSVVAPTLGIPAEISLKMNGQEGSRDPNRRTPIRGDLNLVYEWNCPSCTGPLRSNFNFGGACGTSATGVSIAWMTAPRGTFRVPGSPSRAGCWIDFTLTSQNNPSLSRTFYFDWTPVPAPEIAFTMNGAQGSRDSNNRTQIRGDQDLHYAWSCPSCSGPLRVTYTFGGSCTGGTAYSDQPIEWISSAQGQHEVAGSPSRIGCWINFNVYAPGNPAPQVFYFDWVR